MDLDRSLIGVMSNNTLEHRGGTCFATITDGNCVIVMFGWWCYTMIVVMKTLAHTIINNVRYKLSTK